MSCDLLRIKFAQKTKASAFKDLQDLKETGDQLVYRDPQDTRGSKGRGVKQERKEKRVAQVRETKLKCTINTHLHNNQSNQNAFLYFIKLALGQRASCC